MKRTSSALISLLLLLPLLANAYPYEEEVMQSTDPLVLEGVLIRGNWQITDDAILDMLAWKVGDPFNEKMLAAGQTRLEASELFRDVELSTRRGNVPGSVVVIIRVREKKLPYIDWFKAHHYPTAYSFNLFELETYTSNRKSHLKSELRLTDPWSGLFVDYTHALFGSPSRRIYLTTEATTQSWNVYPLSDREGFDFGLNRFGIGGGLQHLSPAFGKIRLGVDYMITRIGDKPTYFEDSSDFDGEEISDRSQLPLTLRNVEDTNWTGINLTIVKDKRDSELFPHVGSLLFIPVYYGVDSDQRNEFLRFMVDVRRYFPLGSGSTLALRARGGLISGDAPFYQRFSLAQGSGMRGVGFGWVDPPFGGTRMMHGAFELRKPLTGRKPNSFISLLVFAEAGVNWNDDAPAYPQDPDYSDPTVTIGWGLTFRLPVVGPLAIHVGYPLVATEEAEGINVGVKLGMAF